ncbi:MAG: BatA domain-containing protein, partial [Gemmatimonadaceae bacterium]
MGFIAPLWLALGLAAAVPLLLHLMRRRIGTRVVFPAARYLERAEREHSRRLRLRNLLLMALRVLLVLAVAAAAARPVGRVAGAGHAATAMALVLDNSLSTAVVVDGRPVLDRLREAARAALGRAAEGDRLWLVTADGRVVGGSRATLLDAVAHAAPL